MTLQIRSSIVALAVVLALSLTATLTAMGKAAAQEASVPDDALDVHGDWTIRCDAIPDGGTQCALTQAVEAEDRVDVWLNAYAFRPADAEDPTLLSILVPLRVILTKGLGLRIDDAETIVFDFITCSEEGCLASIALTEELMTAMRAGAER